MLAHRPPDPHVIYTEAWRTPQANLALAERIEREWHNLDKLERELASRDLAGERCR